MDDGRQKPPKVNGSHVTPVEGKLAINWSTPCGVIVDRDLPRRVLGVRGSHGRPGQADHARPSLPLSSALALLP